jgi:hypothetical protein
MLIVLNEWIFHDLRGDNGPLRQSEAEDLLSALGVSTDRIVVPDESPWTSKAYQMMKLSDPRRKLSSQAFFGLCVDSNRALRVPTEGIEVIPEELLNQPPVEDVYLVSAYLSGNADVLVTTDVPLYEALADSELVTCRMRDDFLGDYRR